MCSGAPPVVVSEAKALNGIGPSAKNGGKPSLAKPDNSVSPLPQPSVLGRRQILPRRCVLPPVGRGLDFSLERRSLPPEGVDYHRLCPLFQSHPSVDRMKPGVGLSLFHMLCWVFPAAGSCVNSSSVFRVAVADCEPAVHFINPARQSFAAPPAAVGSGGDRTLMDCEVPQFPQPANVPLQPQLPLLPPTGEPRESRGFESLQSSLSTLPGKLAVPIPFLPLEKSDFPLALFPSFLL